MHGAQGAMVSKRKQTHTDHAEPTPERMRKAGADLDVGHDGRGNKTLTMRDSPLERALSRGVVTRQQYDAGKKYLHHWYHAGLSAALGSVDPNRIHAADTAGFSGMAKTESQVFHRQRYRAAVQAVGLTGSGVLDWVVCREVPLEDVGYTFGWGNKPQAVAAATEHLKLALNALAKLWGL